MKQYFKIPSYFIGIGVGFVNFYFLFELWKISWEISFVISFILGHLTANALDIYAGKISQVELDSKKAKEISINTSNFEEHNNGQKS